MIFLHTHTQHKSPFNVGWGYLIIKWFDQTAEQVRVMINIRLVSFNPTSHYDKVCCTTCCFEGRNKVEVNV